MGGDCPDDRVVGLDSIEESLLVVAGGRDDDGHSGLGAGSIEIFMNHLRRQSTEDTDTWRDQA